MILEKYRLVDGFYSGMNKLFPGSGYLDFHEDNLPELIDDEPTSVTKLIADGKEIHFLPSSFVPDEGRGGHSQGRDEGLRGSYSSTS